jgi:hypothetical protein
MKKLFIASALLVSSVAAVQAAPTSKTAMPQQAATVQPAAQPVAKSATKSALPVVKAAKSLSGEQKGQVNGGGRRHA